VGIRFNDEAELPISGASTTRITADGARVFVFELTFEESRCELLADGALKLATLNTKTFNQINALSETAPLSWEGLVTEQALAEAFEDSNSKKVIKICLNVYGPPGSSDGIGLELSRKGLFLQDPDCIRESCRYENPQYLELPAQEFEQHMEPGHLTENPEQQDEGALSLAQAAHGQVSTSTDLAANFEFDHLLDQFAQQKDLRQANVNSRIKTVLLELGFSLTVTPQEIC